MVHGWGVAHKLMSGCFEPVFDKEKDKYMFKLIDNYPSATYITLNKAGHNLQIEQEELFMFILKGWLNNNF